MRPIDADELPLGKFVKPRTEWHKGWNDALDAAMFQAPTIDQYGTWIPFSEGKPKKGEKVIISTKTGVTTMGYYVDRHPCSYAEGFECDSLFMLVNSVLAWMPLPAPYREEKK